VYAREVDGQVLTMFVDGRLWKDSMLMADRETWSLWCHFLGQAMSGKLKGRTLERIPSVLTNWQSWRQQHPQGTVALLSAGRRQFTRADFREPGRFVLGIRSGDKAKAWDLGELSSEAVRNDSWNGKPVVVVFERVSATARLYERTVEGKVLTFRLKGNSLQDTQTGSTWEPVSGRAVAGPMIGLRLAALPAGVAYAWVWRKFHGPPG
jgi:hypothetical protein